MASCADAEYGERKPTCGKTKGRSTYIKGKIRAQELFSILQSEGTYSVEKPMTVTTHKVEITSETEKRLRILGTSIQKLDRSTSFLVAPQMILYEKRWARIACEMWMDNPPKKTKLKCDESMSIICAGLGQTHKKGTQVKFSMKAPKRLRCPRRYSKRENATLPEAGNTTIQAIQISKLWKYHPSTSIANPSRK